MSRSQDYPSGHPRQTNQPALDPPASSECRNPKRKLAKAAKEEEEQEEVVVARAWRQRNRARRYPKFASRRRIFRRVTARNPAQTLRNVTRNKSDYNDKEKGVTVHAKRKYSID